MRKLYAAVVMGSALLFAAMPALAERHDGLSAEVHQARLASVSSQAQRPVIAPTSSPTTSIRVGADDLPRAR